MERSAQLAALQLGFSQPGLLKRQLRCKGNKSVYARFQAFNPPEERLGQLKRGELSLVYPLSRLMYVQQLQPTGVSMPRRRASAWEGKLVVW